MSIRVLPPETAAKIAAGEVIQRPSSVVKELIENSLDAGATRIEVYLEEGGKSLIRVADNGEGIAPHEVELAVKRFATSKLETAEDLVRISSFGFRGEALGSIAEVSELSIETQKQGSESGILMRVHAGKMVSREEVVRMPGTTVTVSRLFFNLPARRAFLKSEPYERRLVLEVVRNYAICFNDVYFDVKGPKQTYACYQPQDDWITRLKEILPDLKNVELIPIGASHSQLSVKGVIVRPDQARELSRMQRTFFNSRPVLYRAIFRAVLEGFGPQPGSQIPFFVLMLSSPPELLDANIHPAKTEVRYRDERFLFDYISQLVRKGLHGQTVANLDIVERPGFRRGSEWISEMDAKQLSMDTNPSLQTRIEGILDETGVTGVKGVTGVTGTGGATSGEYRESADEHPKAFRESQTSFWQLQNSYILAQIASGLVIVDQHAAHERILYEQMLERLSSNSAKQPLLFPLIVELTPEEFATFEEIESELSELGLDAEPFGPNQVMVETLPADSRMSASDLRELFREFNATSEVKLGNRDRMAALISCKAAVKAGRALSQAEMESLINRLFSCKNPYFCPHGRPTVIKFTMDDLDKRFGRI